MSDCSKHQWQSEQGVCPTCQFTHEREIFTASEVAELKAQHEAAMERVFESHRQQVLLLMGDKDRLKAQCAAMLEKAAEIIRSYGMPNEHHLALRRLFGRMDREILALIPTDFAAALAELKAQCAAMLAGDPATQKGANRG